MCSDLYAYHTVMRSFHGDWDPGLRKYTNIAMELLYSSLAMRELFFSHIAGTPLGIESHPPPAIRCRIFYHAMARERGQSKPEFLANEWGAGLVTKFLVDATIQRWLREYRNG